jgi:hypothetical protein
MVDEGKVREAIRILLPRDLQLGNAEFDALKPGDGVRARILRSQFQTNDDYIRATGLFDGLQPSASGPVEALVPAVEDTEAVVKLPGGSNSAAGGPALSAIAEGSQEEGTEKPVLPYVGVVESKQQEGPTGVVESKEQGDNEGSAVPANQ